MGVMKRKIPYEIKSYKSTMFFGLTTRQLICVIGMLVLAVPTVYFGGKILSSDAVGYLILFEVVPFAAAGWLSYNDMPIEQIAVKVFYFFFGTQKRKWVWKSPENKIHDAVTSMELERLTDERNHEIAEEKAAEKQRKAEQKAAEKQRKAEQKAEMKKSGRKSNKTDKKKRRRMNDAG